METSVINLIMKQERALAKAHLDMNLNTINDLLHPDYVILQPDGKVETKQDVLKSYKTGNRRWKKAKVTELKVNQYQDNMVRVIGLWTASGTNNGKHFDYKARFISIWIKDTKYWQNISYQSIEL